MIRQIVALLTVRCSVPESSREIVATSLHPNLPIKVIKVLSVVVCYLILD